MAVILLVVLGTLDINNNIYIIKMFALNLKITGGLLLLVILPLAGCSPEIVEKQITMKEQKSQCSMATDDYEYVSDSYYNQFDSSMSRLGRTIDPGELIATYEEAQRLSPHYERMNKARNSKDFWCEKVKPNSTLYEVRDYVYFSREAAERSIEN